jgi:hypothetical protein
MKTLFQVECQRTNVTPKQFYSYCKTQALKQGLTLDDWIDYDYWTDEKTKIPYHTDEHSDWDVPQREANKAMPFDHQMYLQNGYNIILSFDFWDDKKGCGYMYAVAFGN